MRRAPRLHDPLVGDQLDVSPNDLSREQGKGSALLGVDLGRLAGECRELLRIKKSPIDPLRTRFQVEGFLE